MHCVPATWVLQHGAAPPYDVAVFVFIPMGLTLSLTCLASGELISLNDNACNHTLGDQPPRRPRCAWHDLIVHDGSQCVSCGTPPVCILGSQCASWDPSVHPEIPVCILGSQCAS